MGSEEKLYSDNTVSTTMNKDGLAPPPKPTRKRKVKPDGFPNRPLSAYNLFFKENREKLLLAKMEKKAEAMNVPMVKHIAQLWKTIDPTERARFESMAKEEMERYKVIVKQLKRERKEREKQNRTNKRAKKGVEPEESIPSAAVVVEIPKQPIASVSAARQEECGSISSSSASPAKAQDDIDDEIDRLIEAETKAMEEARSCKLLQMKLVRQGLASNPELAEFLDARRLALGLSPLLQRTKPQEKGPANSNQVTRVSSMEGLPTAIGQLGSVPPMHQPPMVGREMDGFRGTFDRNRTSGFTSMGSVSIRLEALQREEERIQMMMQRDQDAFVLNSRYTDAARIPDEMAALRRSGSFQPSIMRATRRELDALRGFPLGAARPSSGFPQSRSSRTQDEMMWLGRGSKI